MVITGLFPFQHHDGPRAAPNHNPRYPSNPGTEIKAVHLVYTCMSRFTPIDATWHELVSQNDMTQEHSLQVTAAPRGSSGCHTKKIHEETGAKIRIRGQGSSLAGLKTSWWVSKNKVKHNSQRWKFSVDDVHGSKNGVASAAARVECCFCIIWFCWKKSKMIQESPCFFLYPWHLEIISGGHKEIEGEYEAPVPLMVAGQIQRATIGHIGGARESAGNHDLMWLACSIQKGALPKFDTWIWK